MPNGFQSVNRPFPLLLVVGVAVKAVAVHLQRSAALAQTLATILLTRESQFSLELANKRLQILSERIGQLASQPIPLPGAVLPLVREAAGALLARLEAFTARLNRP